MRLKFFSVFGAVTTVGTQCGYEIIRALEDDVLDGPEIGRIVKTALRSLRMAGVSGRDLDQVQVITERHEYEMLDFRNGDVLIYGPYELTSKLKVKV